MRTAPIPQAQVELRLRQGFAFTRTFSRGELDQVVRRPLDNWVEGHAELRTRAGGGDLLLDFDVAINTVTRRVTVTADEAATALVTRSGVFYCWLVHQNGVDLLPMCPPVRMTLEKWPL